MNLRGVVVVGLALTCGASAAVGVGLLKERPAAAAKPATVAVVVAGIDLPRGTEITADMAKTADWPQDHVPSGAISSVDEVVGRTVIIPLLTGEPVIGAKLAASNAGRGIAPLVKPGMRAFTVMTPTLASGVAGLLIPGNKVDLLWTATSTPGATREKDASGGGSTVTLLQNVELLAVDQDTDAHAGQARKELRSVTLLVSEGQAKRLSLAQAKGTVNLALRNDTDHLRADSPGVTLNDIRFPQGPPEETAVRLEPRAEPPRAPVRVRIRTLRGRHPGQVHLELYGRAAVPEPAPAAPVDLDKLAGELVAPAADADEP
jgi:pilus assembly protein CpaB